MIVLFNSIIQKHFNCNNLMNVIDFPNNIINPS